MEGWFKIHRELFKKPIWIGSTPVQKTILITLISMANHKENEWEWKGEPYNLKPGQFITSLDSIVKKCGRGVSVQNVRTALKRFERFGFLSNKSTNQNRLISIVNWGIYQNQNNPFTNKSTSNQQSNNKCPTTNKNEENVEENKNNYTFNSLNSSKESIPDQLAKRLLNNIRKNYKDFKEPILKNWSSDFQLMIEKDNHKVKEIELVVDWCQNNKFWSSIIISPKKLREKYETLVMQIKSQKGEQQREKLKGNLQYSLERPNHWDEPKELTKEGLKMLKKLEDELPY